MLTAALGAPLLANGRPFICWSGTGVSMPFLRNFFAPDGSEVEVLIDCLFNYLLLALPVWFLLWRLTPPFRWRRILFLALAIAWLSPFFLVKGRMDKTNWLAEKEGGVIGAVFAPVPFGPSQVVARPVQAPSLRHPFGTDKSGRDVLSRMIYGARVSLAVGLLATLMMLIVGTAVGLASGYLGGRFDMLVMRLVEIIICFPTFLLLLILMAVMMDRGCSQSILLVIVVIGATSWTGLCRLVRGETLRQRAMPYIQSCETLAVPKWRIMLRHLLPNVAGVIFVSCAFSVAGAILAESGLSFLGFGVQTPTASWGELLNQAFDNPFRYWFLTFWPGFALLLAVLSFNFLGEGLRRVLDPREE